MNLVLEYIFLFDFKMNSIVQSLSILLIGSREVGKSKLLDRLYQNPFIEDYSLTENNHSQTYTLQIQQMSFILTITEMSKILYKIFEVQPVPHFDYIIFVYDLSRTSTWHDLKKYKEQIQKYIGEDSESRYFIIGNKSDKDNLMDVSKVKFFAPHIEISAKSEDLNPIEICKEIQKTAQSGKSINQKPFYSPIINQQFVETGFKTSIPTSLTRIEGSCQSERIIKIMLVGSSNVGKTEINSFLGKQPFKKEYTPTIGVDFRLMNIRYQGKIYKLQCWDLSGGKKFRMITQAYYKAANICFFVYDITNRGSFEQIQNLYSEMAQYNTIPAGNYISVLIGNKSDLQNERTVSYDEGASLATSINSKFYQTSVKEGHCIMEAFLTTVEEFLGKGI